MTTVTPPFVPQLTRGKHRSARKGACFMEFASYLAGERWSDHPRCTHPLLAGVARLVNDNMSDTGRQRLAILVPAVIGLNGDDLRWDATIARRAAMTAMPVASFERQRALAVGLLASEHVLALLDGRPGDEMSDAGRAAFVSVPAAADWAKRFYGGERLDLERFRRRSAPSVVLLSVIGITEAVVPDTDAVLMALLEGVIEDCTPLRADLVEGVGRVVDGELREAPEPGSGGELAGLLG